MTSYRIASNFTGHCLVGVVLLSVFSLQGCKETFNVYDKEDPQGGQPQAEPPNGQGEGGENSGGGGGASGATLGDLGETCDGDLTCESGFCVQGVCCDSPCDGQCEACDLPEAPGLCTPSSGSPCRPASCSDGILTEPASCEEGMCPAETTRECQLGACDGESACLGVVDFSLGAQHSCAALSDGTVRCWGDNSRNQLGQGDDDNVARNVPVPVAGLTDVVEIAAGDFHTCARHADGTVSCWGIAEAGQTGRLTTSGVPAKVPGVEGATSLASGRAQSCAVLSSGQALCWGRNASGELGRGSLEPSFTATPGLVCPVGSTGPCPGNPATNIARIALGTSGSRDHTCAITTEGRVACWGSNSLGQLGFETSSTTVPPHVTPHPTMVAAPLDEVVSIAAGEGVSCAVTATGSARCWGGAGVLGNPTVTSSTTTPQPVCTNESCTATVSDAQAVAARNTSACVLRAGGAVDCWGSQGSWYATFATPRDVSDAALVRTGGFYYDGGIPVHHACALVGSDELLCWGLNNQGQLGVGASDLEFQTPTPVAW